MSLPGGTIAVVSGVLARYPTFMKALMSLERPEGTKLVWSTGAGIAQNRNDAFRHRMGEWVLFLDDDHTFHPDMLINLLKTRKDVVVPLVLRREPPHATVMYTASRSREEGERLGLPWGYHTLFLKDDEPPALRRLVGAGTAGMLIREKVIAALKDPWFEVGQFKPEELSEDLWFSKKVVEAGFEIWGDTRVRMSHITPTAVWPVWKDDRWYTGYEVSGSAQMPLIGPAKEEG